MSTEAVASPALRTDVAVLYVDPRGPYPKLVADWYDEARGASAFAGPGPVVAHPPCGPWSQLRSLNRFQKHEHAIDAVRVVRAVGGVLEHPARSLLWAACGLPVPGSFPDAGGGWTLEVDQVRWGHVAQKRTWIYIVGCAREDLPTIPPMRAATHWVCGSRKPRKGGGVVPAGMKMCSAQLRRRTPPAFAAWLIEVASRCRL